MSTTIPDPLHALLDDLVELHDHQGLVTLLQDLLHQSRQGARLKHMRTAVQFSGFFELAGPDSLTLFADFVRHAVRGTRAKLKLECVGGGKDERQALYAAFKAANKYDSRLAARAAHAQPERTSAPSRVRSSAPSARAENSGRNSR